MTTLAPCPCGKTPTDIHIVPGYCVKHSMVTGNCCAEWHVEFRTEYEKKGSAELHELAVEAWNQANRGCECAAICECGHPRILHYVESNWGCPDPCGCDQYKRAS